MTASLAPFSRLSLVAALLLASCGDASGGGASGSGSAMRRGAPPPTVSVATSAGTCIPTAPSDAPTKAFFPERIGAFCVQGEATSYGKDAKNPITGICDLFDGECQLYLELSVERAVEVRYLAPTGALISIRLSKFDTSEHAFAMFSTRVVGDFDPAVDAPRPLDVGDPKLGQRASGLGVGNVLFVKGAWLFEAEYKDNKLPVDAVKAAADETLSDLVKKVVAALPAGEPPALLSSVPEADRVPLGVRFDAIDGLKMKGVGPAMLGYHKTTDGRRYRTFVSKSPDAAKAQNVFKLLAAKALDPVGPNDAVARVELKEGALSLEWVFAVSGEWVIGVGDESRVLRAGVTGAAHDDLCLPTDKKKQFVADWTKKLGG